jgi:hypothetical protein
LSFFAKRIKFWWRSYVSNFIAGSRQLYLAPRIAETALSALRRERFDTDFLVVAWFE